MMRTSALRPLLLAACSLPALLLAVSAPAGCGAEGDPLLGGSTSETDASGGSGGGEGGAAATGAGGVGGTIATTSAGGSGASGGGGAAAGGGSAGPACGDGALDPGEICDDANGASGDGCTGGCDAVETGFACPVPGEACVSIIVCGDGKILGDETCDDQNAGAGDGCDADCHVEAGWKCLVVGAACSAALCGDAIVAGAEQCDDGAAASADGCSDTCQLEPGYACPTPGAPCGPTTCGDGMAEGSEACDDGDNDMGDGCTPFCTKEPDCTQGACTSSCGDGIKLPGGAEPCEDGNTHPGDGCDASCNVEPGYQCTDVGADVTVLELPIVIRDFSASHPDFEKYLGAELGIVTSDLGADGKPVYANPGATTATTSGQASFDQWYRDVAGVNVTILQTISLGKLPTGEFQLDSASFFPIDGLGWGNEGNARNFHFTSEVRYWFEYEGNEQLDFTGDDDVWVFVNKKLAVDLGGVHGAMSGGILLDPQAALAFGLAAGGIYEIVVFQAERHTTESNYKLTLSNFVNAKSVCTSVCGDGVKTPDEVCDDGTNDGSYGHCDPACLAGPHCGDGIVQPEEECDDGVNLSPYMGCAPGCTAGATCGDGAVDSLFGEQCDDAANDGGYGECDTGCLLGARCGDGEVQPEHEQCDDGNKVGGDGCDSNCQSNVPQ